MKRAKRVLMSITAAALLFSVAATGFAVGEPGGMPGEMGQGMPGGFEGGMPGGGMPPPAGSNAVTETTAVSMTVNGWFFTRYCQEDGSYTTTINSYIGQPENGVVVVPGILGGGVVTEIGQSAFRNTEITTILIPDSVEKLNSWSFYDCVNLTVLTIANPDIVIDDGMCQNSPSEGKTLTIYLDAASEYQPDSSNAVADVSGYNTLTVKMQDGCRSEALNLGALGRYYIPNSLTGSVLSGSNGVLRADVKGELSLSLEQDLYLWTVENYDDSELDLSKDVPGELNVDPALAEKYGLSAGELDQTFYAYTSEEANARNKVTESGEFSTYLSRLTFTEGFYLNGRKVLISPNIIGYDAASGVVLFDYSGNASAESLYTLLPDAAGAKSEGTEAYNYVAYRDMDSDGVIDVLFYAWNVLSSDSTMVTLGIESDDPVVKEYLNGVSGRIALDGNYYSFINGVLSADGETIAMDELEISSTDGNTQNDVQAESNEERSLLWATNGGSITVEQFKGISTSEGNWTKIRDEINSYLGQPMEVIMQWGMNAALYATQGGSITVGDPNADVPNGTYTSSIYTCGDGANGIVATATGNSDGSTTSTVSVYDAEFVLEGWNNHVADCIYGGYVVLDNVKGTTGKEGSYIMNNGSTLANDFGDGVLNVKNYIGEAWGDSSAGAYMIGNGGRLVIADSSLFSHLNAGIKNIGGVVSAKDVDLIGMSGYSGAGTASFEGGTWTLRRDYESDHYVYGAAAAEIAQLWYDVTGSTTLLSYVMSGVGNTYADLWDEYGAVIQQTMNKDNFYAAVNEIADRYGYGEAYHASDEAPLRNSMFDNTYYAIMRNGFQYAPVDGDYSMTALADWSDVPYLYASNLAYLYSALIDCSDEVTISNVTFAYDDSIGEDYRYFSTGTGTVYLNDCEGASGLVIDGVLVFNGTDFDGSFAAGDRGLWDGPVEYTNARGERTRLNGNYAGTENDGAQATFSGGSVWTVTHESYLEKLTLSADAQLIGSVVDFESKETAEDGSVTYINVVVVPSGADAPEADASVYTVVFGDTLWTISQKFFGTGFKWDAIYEKNKDIIKDPNVIFEGQKIAIPAF